jgi:hypothetical protein
VLVRAEQGGHAGGAEECDLPEVTANLGMLVDGVQQRRLQQWRRGQVNLTHGGDHQLVAGGTIR